MRSVDGKGDSRTYASVARCPRSAAACGSSLPSFLASISDMIVDGRSDRWGQLVRETSAKNRVHEGRGKYIPI